MSPPLIGSKLKAGEAEVEVVIVLADGVEAGSSAVVDDAWLLMDPLY